MRQLISFAAVAMMLVLGLSVGIARASDRPVSATVHVDGRDVTAATTGAPVRLTPGQAMDVDVTLINDTDAPIDVRLVQLDARVLGLMFFSYATGVNLRAEPHSSATVEYRLELSGLKGQATGLLSGALSLRDHDENVVVELPTVIDVRGSLVSVYGLFGLVIAVLTALSLLDTALALARHRLPTHRWQRGMRVMLPGIGIGLMAAFSASVARLWVAETHSWLMVAGGCAAVMFAVGYFSPTPNPDRDAVDVELADDEIDGTDTVKLADSATRATELRR